MGVDPGLLYLSGSVFSLLSDDHRDGDGIGMRGGGSSLQIGTELDDVNGGCGVLKCGIGGIAGFGVR